MVRITQLSFSLALILSLLSVHLNAQNFVITNGQVQTCDGFFQDSGGATGNYSENEDFTYTICSDGSFGDTHVQLIFANTSLGTGDTLTFYDGPDAGSPQIFQVPNPFEPAGNAFIVQASAANPGGCITVVFQSNADGDVGAGWNADINCITSCQLITAVLASSDPPVSPVDTGWIDACPGQRITFNGTGLYPQNGVIYNHSDLTSTFEWDFGDGTTAVGPNVTHIYDEPGGYIVQLTITDQNDCYNTNFISQRVRISTYPIFGVGGTLDTEICAGDTIELIGTVNEMDTSYNVSVMPTSGSFQAGGIRSDSLPLPDGTGAVYETSIEITDFSPGQTLASIEDLMSICVNMEHSWMFDLDVFISCPDGTQVILQNQEFIGNETYLGIPIDGDDGSNPPPQGEGFDYCWTPDADLTWTQHIQQFDPHTLPSGDYAAFGDLEDLVGCPLNGEWTIIVQDQWGSDNGWIFEWSINFDPSIFPNLETFTPTLVDYGWEENPTVFFETQDSIAASPQNAGSALYTFWVTDDFGCTYDTSLVFDILPPTHPNCHNCEDNYTPTEDITLCGGDGASVDLSGEVELETQVTFETFPMQDFGFTTNPVTSPLVSNLNVNSIAPLTLTDPASQIESVCISIDNIQVFFVEDLTIRLRTPTGEQINLITPNTVNGNRLTNTCFSPAAANPINSGTSPYTGTFQPVGNWADLAGAQTNGNWALLISDNAGIELGEFVSWSITFNSSNEITFDWTPPTGLSCDDCPDPDIMPPSNQDYIITIDDLYGCTIMDTLSVSIVQEIPAPIVECAPNGNGGLDFTWNAVGGLTNYEVNVIINGVPGGWQGPITATTFLVDGLNLGDEVTLQVRGYTAGSPLNCDVETGESTCVYNECGVNDVISIDSITMVPATCYSSETGSASVFITDGAAPYAYQWSDDLQQINQTAVFLEAGTYTVTVTDAFFCQTEAQIEVTQPDSLIITLDAMDTPCFGTAEGSAIAMPEGGTSTYTFAWDNGAITNEVNNLMPGNHSVTVTDANNCEAEMDFTIGQPATQVTADAQQTLEGCNGDEANEATVVGSGGTGTNYTYSWEDGQIQATATNLAPGMTTVTVTDEAGCEAIDTVMLMDLEPLFANMIIGRPTCNGLEDGSLGINNFGGGNGEDGNEDDYTFVWSTGDQGVSIVGVPGGITYTVTITDTQGCSTEISRLLPDPAPITFATNGTNALCFGSADGTATVSNVMGENDTFTFQWDANAHNQTTATATGLPAGTYNVTVTDEAGCESYGSVDVGQPTSIDINYDTEDNDCFGDANGEIATTVRGGVPGYAFNWSNGATDEALTDLIAGIYTLTITDINGCEQVEDIEIIQPDPLEAEIQTKDVSCFGDRDGTIFVNPSGGNLPYQFSLDNNDFLGTGTLIGLTAGTYNIYIVDGKGCRLIDQAVVNEPAEFIVDAGEDQTILLGDSIRLFPDFMNAANGADPEFVWSAPYDSTLSCTECRVPWASPETTITYELYAVDENGCEDTDLVTVFVEKPRLAVVPTGFTPNGDNMNDLLLVHGREGTRVKVFRVYDRWGEMVYENGDFMVNDPNQGWDGTFRDEPLIPGVYIWYLEVEYPFDQMEESFQGQTTLIR